MSSYYYIDLSLKLKEDSNVEVTQAFFKQNIIRAVRNLFGESASYANIDILKYNEKTLRAILRIPKHLYVKVHASLTLCGKYATAPCVYIIHKTSPLLLSLLAESRDYKH